MIFTKLFYAKNLSGRILHRINLEKANLVLKLSVSFRPANIYFLLFRPVSLQTFSYLKLQETTDTAPNYMKNMPTYLLQLASTAYNPFQHKIYNILYCLLDEKKHSNILILGLGLRKKPFSYRLVLCLYTF